MTGDAQARVRKHLGATDKDFAALIRRIGPVRIEVARRRSPYEALVRAIAHQQLHARAAEAILGRMLALAPGEDFPSPEVLLGHDASVLRACGFSASKIAALHDIAARAADGTIPNRVAARRLDDAALIERLTSVRGVGRWTVEMLLIFTLGRPDVLPVDDFGVREGWRLLKRAEQQPRPRELAEIGAAWAPYRSAAAWYLWRSADEGKKIKVVKI